MPQTEIVTEPHKTSHMNCGAQSQLTFSIKVKKQKQQQKQTKQNPAIFYLILTVKSKGQIILIISCQRLLTSSKPGEGYRTVLSIAASQQNVTEEVASSVPACENAPDSPWKTPTQQDSCASKLMKSTSIHHLFHQAFAVRITVPPALSFPPQFIDLSKR